MKIKTFDFSEMQKIVLNKFLKELTNYFEDTKRLYIFRAKVIKNKLEYAEIELQNGMIFYYYVQPKNEVVKFQHKSIKDFPAQVQEVTSELNGIQYFVSCEEILRLFHNNHKQLKFF